MPLPPPEMKTDTILIDLVDACNLACRTCIRGLRVMKNRRGQMSLPVFKEVLKKCIEHNISRVFLYNWSEPFLTKNLHLYTQMVKNFGLYCELSSNLSFKHIPHLIDTLKNVDFMYVSLSGFNQSTYSVNHFGGNIENVKRNLVLISDAKKNNAIKTIVRIKYFNFPYSIKEWPLIEKFGTELGLEVRLVSASGDPIRMERALTPRPDIVRYFTTIPEPKDDIWPLTCEAQSRLSIDMDCNVYACCGKINSSITRLGNLLEDDFDILEYKRYRHPICLSCASRNPRTPNMDVVKTIHKGLIKLYSLERDKTADMISLSNEFPSKYDIQSELFELNELFHYKTLL